MNIPKKISRPKSYYLQVDWGNNEIYRIKLQIIRNNCPCAECAGEEFPSIDGKKRISMPSLNTFKPGKYELKDLKPVGNYGIQPFWGDGHDAGLFTWEQFYELTKNNNLTDDEIDKIENQSKN